MQNARLDKAQSGIKIAGENINNLRYADDTILMAESEEELKYLLMKVKEKSVKVGLKFNIQKTKIMASSSITSCQIDGGTMETRDFIFLGSKITVDSGSQPTSRVASCIVKHRFLCSIMAIQVNQVFLETQKSVC